MYTAARLKTSPVKEAISRSTLQFLPVPNQTHRCPASYFTLIKCPIFKDGARTTVILLLDHDALLGEGSFGAVLPAYIVDQKTGFIINDRPDFAIKIAEPGEKISENEVRFISACQVVKIYSHGQIGDLNYCLMEYFVPYKVPGISPDPKDIYRRLNYIVSICSQVQQLHRGSRNGIIHGDIKLENTLIIAPKDADDMAGNIFLTDFGLSESMPDWLSFERLIETRGIRYHLESTMQFDFFDDLGKQHHFAVQARDVDSVRRIYAENNRQIKHPLVRAALIAMYEEHSTKLFHREVGMGPIFNSAYFPPEAQNGSFCMGTDIYMLCGLIVQLLAPPSLSGLRTVLKFDTSRLQTLMFPHFPAINMPVGTSIVSFLNKMQAPNLSERPSIEAVLHFFNQLRKLYRLAHGMTLSPRDYSPTEAAPLHPEQLCEPLLALADFDYIQKMASLEFVRSLAVPRDIAPSAPASADERELSPYDRGLCPILKAKVLGIIQASIGRTKIEVKNQKLSELQEEIKKAGSNINIKRIISTACIASPDNPLFIRSTGLLAQRTNPEEPGIIIAFRDVIKLYPK